MPARARRASWTSGDSIAAGVRATESDPSLLAGYRLPQSSWAKTNRRNLTAFAVLLYLGAAYESLYVVGVLPFSILAPMPLFTPETMPILAFLTACGATWLLLKGLRGFGDMRLTSQGILTPGRTVRSILRGAPGLLPLDRVSAIRVLSTSMPRKIEIRYRADSGQERRALMPLDAVPDLDGFLSGLSDRGVRVEEAG